MRLHTLDHAIAEARRFLDAADMAKRVAGSRDYKPDGKSDPYLDSGQYTAAIRRASMDLSRALADVRRGH